MSSEPNRVDVADLFDPARAIELKRQRQARLAQVLSGRVEPDPTDEALDQLAEAVADRVVAKLTELTERTEA
jgi:hypothetical protein